MGSITGLGRSSRGGHGNPLQYSSLENTMDRGTQWATVYRVANSWTYTNTSLYICLQYLSINGENHSSTDQSHFKSMTIPHEWSFDTDKLTPV